MRNRLLMSILVLASLVFAPQALADAPTLSKSPEVCKSFTANTGSGLLTTMTIDFVVTGANTGPSGIDIPAGSGNYINGVLASGSVPTHFNDGPNPVEMVVQYPDQYGGQAAALWHLDIPGGGSVEFWIFGDQSSPACDAEYAALPQFANLTGTCVKQDTNADGTANMTVDFGVDLENSSVAIQRPPGPDRFPYDEVLGPFNLFYGSALQGPSAIGVPSVYQPGHNTFQVTATPWAHDGSMVVGVQLQAMSDPYHPSLYAFVPLSSCPATPPPITFTSTKTSTKTVTATESAAQSTVCANGSTRSRTASATAPGAGTGSGSGTSTVSQASADQQAQAAADAAATANAQTAANANALARAKAAALANAKAACPPPPLRCTSHKLTLKVSGRHGAETAVLVGTNSSVQRALLTVTNRAVGSYKHKPPWSWKVKLKGKQRVRDIAVVVTQCGKPQILRSH